MAGLPDADLAIVDGRMITLYLLAGDHPAGRARAVLFQRFGFRVCRWHKLRDALFDHARTAPIAAIGDTRFGRKYSLEGALSAPDGRRPQVRTVWFVRRGEIAARLVTAYPLRGAGE